MFGPPVTPHASAARTSTGQTGAFAIGDDLAGGLGGHLNLILNVTAVSGTTPSMTCSVQWSVDGTTWATPSPADAFAAVTATGAVVQQFAVKAPFYRVVYTITGTTPSFTFDIKSFITN